MADYKKKTVKKTPAPKKAKGGSKKLSSFSTVNKEKNAEKPQNDIKMKPAKTAKTKTANQPKPKQAKKPRQKRRFEPAKGLRLLIGKKGQIQKKRVIILAVCLLLAVGILLFVTLTPTGPFEYIENKINAAGSGDFPASIEGSELYDAHSSGSIIYTLSDTNAEIYNFSGKQVFSRQHDFNSPMISTSSQRALLYDAGGKNIYIYNYGDVVDEINTEREIYCADISRNGTVAIATKSDGYASEVQVLSKGGKVKFIWYSASEIVNNVALSNNGKRLAVSTVDTSGGSFRSKVYIFKYSSAEPVHQFVYDDSVVYSLSTLSSKHFSVVTDKTVDFIKWKGGSRTQNTNNYSLNLYRVCGKNNIAVRGNKSNNTITVFGSSGKIVTEFEFLGAVSDISYKSGRIFILSDGYLYTLNKQGESVFDKINLSGYSRIFATDSNTVIAAGNFGFDKFNLK